MTEPSPHGVPGDDPTPEGPVSKGETPRAGGQRFADLAQRSVAEHVEVFEAEHARLQRELGTIDSL
jgi:hypothetical protein